MVIAMKNKLFLDFLREIKNSFGRFISIFFIVLLGTAFFAGLRSSGTDMKLSADAYYKDTSLMDIKLLGTLGFTEAELDYFKEVEGVSLLKGVRTKDVLLESNRSELVMRLIEYTDEVNKPYLLEGRLPENEGECLLDSKIFKQRNMKLGDSLSFKSGNSTSLSDDLSHNHFIVTGVCHLPYYLELGRGVSRIGDGSVDGFLLVKKEIFKSDIYSEVYVKLENTDSLLSYSKEYEKLAEPVISSFESLEYRVSKSRLSSIQKEALRKIADAEEEISDGEKKLSDGKRKLKEGKSKLLSGKNTLKKEEKRLVNAERQLLDGEKKLFDAEKKWKKGFQSLEDGEKKLLKSKDTLKKETKKYRNGLSEYQSGKEQYKKGRKALEKGEEDLTSGKLLYQKNQDAFNASVLEYQTALSKYEEGKALGLVSLETEKYLSESLSLLEQKRPILEQTKKNLDEKETELAVAKKELFLSKEKLTSASLKLSLAKEKLNESQKELNHAEGVLVSKKEELLSSRQTLEQEAKKLLNAKRKISKGRRELELGKKKFLKQKKKLTKAEKEYEEKLPNALSEISSAKAKVRDAKKELLDLKEPDYYVLGRNKMDSYVSFSQNADRMDNIGNVFPVIFFLVAALVSLTAMTRMVDEGRINMGTLKALGFSNLRISAKYLAYSLLATLSGSLLGISLGERYLPMLILRSYQTLFIGMPYVSTPINYEQALLALVAAVISTGGATLFSCFHGLREQPASLMRPLPPKHGQRVLLERLPFLWNRLNFTRKSTIRNLSRYKKRLIMTVIGIGGCMGLLLVGFGLRDSIQEIAKNQYVNIFTYDARLSINSKSNSEDISLLKKEASSYPGVENTNEVYMQTIKLLHDGKERESFLFVPSETENMDDFLILKERKKRKVLAYPKKGAFLSEKTANMLGVKVGDEVKITKEGWRSVSIKVEKIIENYVFHYIFLSKETFLELYGSLPSYNNLFLSYERGFSKEHELGTYLLSLPACSGVLFVTELEEDIDKMLRVLTLVIFVLISSAGLLAFVVLYNLNSINILERKRELATLKVLGFYDSEVSSYVYRENILLTILGIFAGILFGTILHLFVVKTVEVDLMMFGRRIHFMSYLFSILITFFFSFLVNLVMHFSLKKIDMIESLKSIE